MALLKNKRLPTAVPLLLLFVVCSLTTVALARIEAIFTLGDSTVDVGNNKYLNGAIMKAGFLPYGKLFMPKSGRFSDGKLFIDYLSEQLGLPYAPPSLKTRTSTKQGANFAVAGAGIFNETNAGKTLTMWQQISRLVKYKIDRAANVSDAHYKNSLFVISVGSEDFLNLAKQYKANALKYANGPNGVTTFAVNALNSHISLLYRAVGARKFLIVDLPALGCSPAMNVLFNSPGTCAYVPNTLAAGFNARLPGLVSRLQKVFTDGKFLLAQNFAFTRDASAGAPGNGYGTGFGACCGAPAPLNAVVQCGRSGIVNGKRVRANVCPRSASYVFWDNRHFSQVMQRRLAINYWAGPASVITPINLKTLSAIS